jgi:hypothetical protein
MSDKDLKSVKLAGVIAGAVVLLSVVVMLLLKQSGGAPAAAPGAPDANGVIRTPAGSTTEYQRQLEAQDKAAAAAQGGGAGAPAAGTR